LITLFSAVPVFLLKEIPYCIAKFTVFDISTEMLYESFPVAREDLQLSLLVTLAGGTLGGIAAAIVSNPADATVSEMKKAKSDDGPITTFLDLLNTGGIPAIFRGLGIRMVFFTILVGLQFLVYDAIRFSFGVGSDDLKLYLDVLGGALRETGGPI
jgi:solute carrier family 25 phosphate transporter 3